MIGFLALLVTSPGCIGEKPPAATAAPTTTQPTTFSKELLEKQLELLLMNLAYDEKAAQSIAGELVSWTDEEGNSLIGTREGELIDAKERYKKGEITIDELTDKEIWIVLELSRKIKTEVPDYNISNWHLEDVISEGGANCVGYTQLLYVLGKAVGLSVEPIEVVESRDLKEAHVTGLLGLSDARKAMVELTSSTAYVSQPFILDEEYKEAGNYLQVQDKEGLNLPHTRIRILDKEGLMATVFISRAANFDSSGEYKRAIAENVVAIELDPKYALAYNNRGVTFHRLGYLYDALADLDEAIKLNPELADAYSNRGVVHADMGNYSTAISDHDKAIELSDDPAVAYYNRGVAYDHLGDYSKAMSDYDKAIELTPKYANAYYSRGDAYTNLGEYEKAIADYDKAIELNPDFAEACSNRGMVYANMKDYSRAISDYTKAIELNLESAATYYNRGNAHYNLGEYEKALADYTKAIELEPDFAEAYNNRGNSYIRLGESQKAQDDFDTAGKLDPSFKR